ncbi:SMODS domain-containing nucleotidyltransferase [Fictibacillus sp. NRS-1165]|uniref:SMODS domain-containing nucleotidyltransferase n=1 Tax=Fictibacillus sp. NRS-1165 TaxID=3144463 RepID=UPI003D25A42F
MTVTEYLESLLEGEKINDKDKEEIVKNREEVEKAIREKFGEEVKTVKYSGSIAKHTAINSSKDLDLAVHFKHDSFSLSEMYESVFDFLNENYNVREQKVSIGLPDLNVDVVPGRRIDKEDDSNNDVFLYRSDDDSRIKTNIEKHKSHITNSGCRNEIKLMKIWKNKWNVKFKSFAVELLVIQALNGSSKIILKDRIKEVLDYILENVEEINLIDPANSNNNVADIIEDYKKMFLKTTASTCLSYLENVNGDQDSQLSAWKKVFNDFSGGGSNSYTGIGVVTRNTADWGRQPDRRHG